MTTTLTIDGSYSTAWTSVLAGYEWGGSPVWRSTGLYCPPGGTVRVTVPPAASDSGKLAVHIGCHTDDNSRAAHFAR